VSLIVEKLLQKKSWQIDPWLVFILACFILFAWVSWAKLMQPIFDTGSEIEIAARLLDRQVLYHDLQTYYPPLSYYFNALALLVFGQNLETFYAVGLVLALAVILLAYRLVKQLTNATWTALCIMYLLVYSVFNPGGWTNLVAPYNYGAVYATVFCLLAFTALDCYGQTGWFGWLLLSTLSSGLAGLSKQEFGVAALIAVLVGTNLCVTKSFKARIIRNVFVILVTVSCVLLPFTFLAQQASWQEIYTSLIPISKAHVLIDSGLFNYSLARTLEVWRNTFCSFIASLIVIGVAIAIAQRITNYLVISEQRVKCLAETSISVFLGWLSLFLLQIPLEVDIPKVTLAISLLVVNGLALVFWKFLKLGGSSANSSLIRLLIQIFLVISITGVSIFLVRRVGVTFDPLGNLTWLLPLLVGWFAMQWRSLIRHQHSVLLWSLLTFTVLLISRYWFSIDGYGIYAVVPILLLFTLLYQITGWTELPFWNFVLVGLLIGGGTHLAEFTQYKHSISSVRGEIYTDNTELAAAYNQAIGYVNNSGAKSVLTIPHGAVLNFLTATHSPSRETFFLPGVLPDITTEREFLIRMRESPPDLIIYVDVPSQQLNKGYQTFAEYNSLVDDWITHQHQLVYSSPHILRQDREWTIRIYK
jgi:hypothetical protein